MNSIIRGYLALGLCISSLVLRSCHTQDQGTGGPPAREPQTRELPDIMTFASRPSDRFIVNLDQVLTGHPFLGARSPNPHAGAHVHFDDARFKDARTITDYPPIYAAVDGIITRVDYCFPLSSSTGLAHDRYGLDLSFATDKEDGSLYSLAYSIEPMVRQPSVDFYRRFILVAEGQHVKKGDIIAYMYVPPEANGTHVHFDINNFPKHRDHKMAPALFTPDVVQRFYETWRQTGSRDGATPIPPCMGYLLGEYENPFGGAVDKL